MSRIASVLLPMPLPEAFDYAEPEGMDLSVGDQVAAPLGPRTLRGVVVALREAAGGNRPLKPLEARLEEPALPPATLEFVQWAARYAVDAPGHGRDLVVGVWQGPDLTSPERQVLGVVRVPAECFTATPPFMLRFSLGDRMQMTVEFHSAEGARKLALEATSR